jgi:hypothetical protein
MASVMGIGSEVFGRCVEEINVSAEVEKEEPGFAVGGNILRLFRRQKRLKFGSEGS